MEGGQIRRRILIGSRVVSLLSLIYGVFLIWIMIVEPQPLPAFRLTSLSLTNFNLSPSNHSLTADWKATFQIYNPRKYDIPSSEFHASISYKSAGGHVLAQVDQTSALKHVVEEDIDDDHHHGTSSFNLVLSANDSYVDGWSLHEISKEIQRRGGSLSFSITLLVDYRYVFLLDPRFLKVLCNDLVVEVSPTGGFRSFIGGGATCITNRLPMKQYSDD